MLKTHCVTNLRASTQRCARCVLELLETVQGRQQRWCGAFNKPHKRGRYTCVSESPQLTEIPADIVHFSNYISFCSEETTHSSVVVFFFDVWSMVILRNTTLQIKLGLDHDYTMVTPKRQRSCQRLRTVLPWCRCTHRRCWPYGRSRMPSCRQGWWRLANGALGFLLFSKGVSPDFVWMCLVVFLL